MFTGNINDPRLLNRHKEINRLLFSLCEPYSSLSCSLNPELRERLEETIADQIVAKHYLKLGVGNLRRGLQSRVDTYNRLRLSGRSCPLNSFVHTPGQHVIFKRPNNRKNQGSYGRCSLEPNVYGIVEVVEHGTGYALLR